jgi:hypothetical protein
MINGRALLITYGAKGESNDVVSTWYNATIVTNSIVLVYEIDDISQEETFKRACLFIRPTVVEMVIVV